MQMSWKWLGRKILIGLISHHANGYSRTTRKSYTLNRRRRQKGLWSLVQFMCANLQLVFKNHLVQKGYLHWKCFLGRIIYTSIRYTENHIDKELHQLEIRKTVNYFQIQPNNMKTLIRIKGLILHRVINIYSHKWFCSVVNFS